MKKRMTAIGNSLGIVIERPILELLNIDRDTEVEMITDGDRLIIQPIRKGVNQKAMQAAKRIMDNHDKTFRKLAK
jgi:antitoxin MazE